MSMCSISPARRRKSHQIMREVNENVDQVPMPNGVGVGIGPTLHKPIISVPSRHIMADQNPRPPRQGQVGAGRELHRRLVEREVE